MDENSLEDYGQHKRQLLVQRLLPKLNELHDEHRSMSLTHRSCKIGQTHT